MTDWIRHNERTNSYIAHWFGMMIITAWDSLKTDLDLLLFGDLSFHAGFRPLGLSTRVLSYPPHPPTMPSKGQDVCILAGMYLLPLKINCSSFLIPEVRTNRLQYAVFFSSGILKTFHPVDHQGLLRSEIDSQDGIRSIARLIPNHQV